MGFIEALQTPLLLYNTVLVLFNMKATTDVSSLGVYKVFSHLPLYNTALTLFDMKVRTIVSSLELYKTPTDRDPLPFSMSPVHFQA